MKKATVLGIVVLTASLVLLDFSEGAGDFFQILDQTTAEYLMSDTALKLHRSSSSSSSAAAVTGPRNNKYLEASMQIIRGMAEPQMTIRGLSAGREKQIARYIKKAIRDGEIPKARKMIGKMLHPECHCPRRQGRCQESGLPRHCRKRKQNKHKNVFRNLRSILDETDFDNLLGISGDVSLIFVIDTTGSMGDEIAAAKKIAKAIAAHPRDSPVDFILSPFNDPKWGNTYRCPNEKSFVQALDTLIAKGGLDCPELTFNGIIDAIEKGDPFPGSPMFVFTDAGAKEGDGPKYTFDNARGLALEYMIPVNFFYSTESGSCGSFESHDTFVELLDDTQGLGLQFNSSGEIQRMGGVISAALDGTATILEGRSSGATARLRRPHGRASGRDKTYTLPVDNTVGKLIISFFASKEARLVQLRNPNGLLQPRTEDLAQGGVWIIEEPVLGLWELVIPAEVGTHSFKVQSSSGFNLEFDYFFLLRKNLGGRWFEYPTDYPLLGQNATVSLVIPLKERLNLPSLCLSLVDGSGRVLQDATLDTTSLVATFVPIPLPLKFQLSGSTAAGRPFQRISRSFIKAKNVLLRLQRGIDYKTLECGRTLRMSFTLYYNGAQGESFDVVVNSSLVVKTSTDSTKRAIESSIYPKIVKNTMKDRKVFFTVKLQTPRNVSGILNEWDTVQVTVKKPGAPIGSDTDVTSFTEHFKVTCSP